MYNPGLEKLRLFSEAKGPSLMDRAKGYYGKAGGWKSIAATSASSATAALAARHLAKKKARKLGLEEGSKEYKKFVNRRTAAGAAVGAAAGAAGSYLGFTEHGRGVAKKYAGKVTGLFKKKAVKEAAEKVAAESAK